MNIAAELKDFQKKFANPLLADITRTLEVTCYNSGEENHGSNFIGNIVVLIGIEATSQFINPHSKEDIHKFCVDAKTQYEGLEGIAKEYLTCRPSMTDGSKLAKIFMNEYFGDWFSKKREFGVPLAELIWAFRNPHAHTFYPHYRKRINDKEVSGAVDWLYKDKVQKIGIKISEIESQFDAMMKSLYTIEGNCFRICPQILFVFFKRALKEFLVRLNSNDASQIQFLDSYKRLSGVYGFADSAA